MKMDWFKHRETPKNKPNLPRPEARTEYIEMAAESLAAAAKDELEYASGSELNPINVWEKDAEGIANVASEAKETYGLSDQEMVQVYALAKTKLKDSLH